MRLRLTGESFKLCKVEFSTFRRFICGREWITQRLTARFREILDSAVMLSGATPRLVPLGQQSQAKGIELDEAARILLVIGTGIILEGHMGL